ncbi:hypothetical protein AK812_SmicGene4792 [Symbiodinium microadriaticum]|uniref:Uncharacterized protein n=1 Tax=Symbiodinium microadriaticum TaxID=2951 RepID=A0A1Q9EV97_SYMMI|nr:hypothetical protein AK812_SmicGene4792 [Symbiodinium microadriaticum]
MVMSIIIIIIVIIIVVIIAIVIVNIIITLTIAVFTMVADELLDAFGDLCDALPLAAVIDDGCLSEEKGVAGRLVV